MSKTLEDKYTSFNKFINNNNISENEMLFLISNYILDNIDFFTQKDIILGNFIEDPKINYKDYDEIKNNQLFYDKTFSFKLAIIAHQILFINNNLLLKNSEHYSITKR